MQPLDCNRSRETVEEHAVIIQGRGVMIDKDELEQHRGWIAVIGLGYILLGVLAVALPVWSTVGLTFVLAGLFIAGGLVKFVQAMRLRHHLGSASRFFHSLLALVIGSFIAWRPNIGMLGISLTLSFYFFTAAILQWRFAHVMLKSSLRNWRYLSAISSFAIAVYIIVMFPLSALWVPGLLLGIGFLSEGAGLVGIAIALRQRDRPAFRSSLNLTT